VPCSSQVVCREPGERSSGALVSRSLEVPGGRAWAPVVSSWNGPRVGPGGGPPATRRSGPRPEVARGTVRPRAGLWPQLSPIEDAIRAPNLRPFFKNLRWGARKGGGDASGIQLAGCLRPRLRSASGRRSPPKRRGVGRQRGRQYGGQASFLYLQEEDGRFTDVTREAGILRPDSKCMGLTVLDFDADGGSTSSRATTTRPTTCSGPGATVPTRSWPRPPEWR
jgi:hypothetical protein